MTNNIKIRNPNDLNNIQIPFPSLKIRSLIIGIYLVIGACFLEFHLL